MAKSKDGAMKCLSIQQPWAWAVCAGIKTVENRNWSTNHRGMVAIHAASKTQQVDDRVKASKLPLSTSLFTYSAIIGVAELVDVVEMNAKLEDNPFAIGQYCWMFEKPRLLARPIRCDGRLRLYALSSEESQEVQRQTSLPGPIPDVPATDAWRKLLTRADDGIHKARGGSYVNLNRGDDAIRNFDRAFDCDPKDISSLYCRALTWTWLKENAFSGIADCTKVLQLDSKFVDAYLLRAAAHRMLDNETQAKADEASAESLDPGSVERWNAENNSDD